MSSDSDHPVNASISSCTSGLRASRPWSSGSSAFPRPFLLTFVQTRNTLLLMKGEFTLSKTYHMACGEKTFELLSNLPKEAYKIYKFSRCELINLYFHFSRNFEVSYTYYFWLCFVLFYLLLHNFM